MVGWQHIRPVSGMGLEEQWVFRALDRPLCSLKRGETTGTWIASLLNHSGISAVVCHTAAASLERAQRNCEKELREMGWNWAMSQ